MGGIRCWLMTAMLMLLAFPAAAQGVGPGPHIHIDLVAETDRPAPGGDVALAFVSRPDPGWHAYWQNPGDAGFPVKASWSLPEAVTAGPLQYPVPGRLLVAGLMNYVYEGPFVQLVTLHVGELGVGAALPIKVKLQFLVCTDKVCVPGNADLAATLTLGDGAIAPERRAQFDRWRAALPRPLGADAIYQVDQGRIRIAVPFPASAAASQVYFYPGGPGAIDYAAPQAVTRDGDRLVIETKAAGPAAGPFAGVLAVAKDRGFALRAVPGSVPAAAPPSAPWLAAVIAFAGAVLGGLLLNIMPCVFPILSLKALSLAKSNHEAGHPRAEALAYAAGVILVCLALGGALLALRAGGATLGWAFQLQDPRVILLLLLLVTGIALNLAGLFEMSAPGLVNRVAAQGAGGAFMTGALAAFIATPCTGPFMGAALGAALVLPWGAAMAVFGGLGLGIALPFLLIGFVPALRRRLPRPGAWMVTLRHILSIPMFLTALALAWVLGRQAGVDGMTIGLGAALLASLGLWWVGRRQARGRTLQWLPALPLLVLAAAAALLLHPAPAGAGQQAVPRRRALQRGAAGRADCAASRGLRLFHRRLVPHLQGQREGCDRDRCGGKGLR